MSYSKRTLKNEVSDAIGGIAFKSMLIFLRANNPGLQGMAQTKDFLEIMLATTLLKYLKGLGYQKVHDMLDWEPKPAAKTLETNCHRILAKLQIWTKAHIVASAVPQLTSLAVEAHFDHTSFPKACLWVDSFDLSVIRCSETGHSEYYSNKLGRTGARYMVLRAANNAVVWLSPGYSPKTYDSRGISFYKNELEDKFGGAGIFADEHFAAAKASFPSITFYCPHSTKGRRPGDSNVPRQLTDVQQKWNNKQRQARAIVEQPFATLKQKWKCFDTPFQEGVAVLDQLINVTFAIQNIRTLNSRASKKRKRE